MIKIQKIFFCDNVEITQFNKRSFIDVILSKEIYIATIPYKFITNLVIIGEITEECEIILEISTDRGVLGQIPLKVELGIYGNVHGLSLSVKLLLDLQNTGDLFLKIFKQNELLFSDTFTFILGDSPNLNQHKHLPNSGIFSEPEDSQFIKEVISLAKLSVVLIDNYIRSSFELRKLLENVIDFNNEIIVFTKSRYKKAIEEDYSLPIDFPNLKVFYTTPNQDLEFHDRYIIIDKIVYYSFGASLNDISSNKVSGFKKITSEDEIEALNKIIFKLMEEDS